MCNEWLFYCKKPALRRAQGVRKRIISQYLRHNETWRSLSSYTAFLPGLSSLQLQYDQHATWLLFAFT